MPVDVRAKAEPAGFVMESAKDVPAGKVPETQKEGQFAPGAEAVQLWTPTGMLMTVGGVHHERLAGETVRL